MKQTFPHIIDQHQSLRFCDFLKAGSLKLGEQRQNSGALRDTVHEVLPANFLSVATKKGASEKFSVRAPQLCNDLEVLQQSAMPIDEELKQWEDEMDDREIASEWTAIAQDKNEDENRFFKSVESKTMNGVTGHLNFKNGK